MNKRMVLIVAVVIAALTALYVVSERNGFVHQELGITAAYDSNQAVLDQISQSIQGTNLAAKQYSDVVIKAITAGMSGRYGTNGSQASMQWIKENQQGIDPAVYSKLQQVIEANYATWKAAQVTLRDRVRVYEGSLQDFPGNMVASLTGFPRRDFDMALYKRMIVTEGTTEAFKTGRMQNVGNLLGGDKK